MATPATQAPIDLYDLKEKQGTEQSRAPEGAESYWKHGDGHFARHDKIEIDSYFKTSYLLKQKILFES